MSIVLLVKFLFDVLLELRFQKLMQKLIQKFLCYVFYYYILRLQLLCTVLPRVMNISFLVGLINECFSKFNKFGMLLQLF